MGLIPSSNVSELTPELEKVILNTFSLVIINEWDQQQRRAFPKSQMMPGKYMATRYLQLQHPSRQGRTSGDGRGIWNGEIRHRGVTWDVMSSGTGATRLSPAVAKEGRFFRSGDPQVCYGNGYNTITDGLAAALMSESLYREGVSTERTLALIRFPGGSSINVRAGKNLLRPSHLFLPLKQGDHQGLIEAVHYCIERERLNGNLVIPKDWRTHPREAEQLFCEKVVQNFARASARFRSDQIFCWLDWDGDNILCDGGIIDYGSIRRFGAYHRGYRYDDGDRWSTRLGEQKERARYIAQTFVQILDFLKTGTKKPIRDFSHDPILDLFDRVHEEALWSRNLWKVGLSEREINLLLDSEQKNPSSALQEFKCSIAAIEGRQSRKGIRSVPDGEVSHGVFSLKRFFLHYPQLWRGSQEWVGSRKLSELCRTEYATRRDLLQTPPLRFAWRRLEQAYRNLNQECAHRLGVQTRQLMAQWSMRASQRNRTLILTGDGVLAAMEILIRLSSRRAQRSIPQILDGLSMKLLRSELTRKDKDTRRVLLEIERYQDGI